MDSPFFKDPSIIFTIVITLTPCVLHYDKPSAWVVFLTDPVFVAAVALTCFIEFCANKRSRARTSEEKGTNHLIRARWYLINCMFFHTVYDLYTGVIGGWTLMNIEYRKLDGRFEDVWHPGSMTATTCCLLEGFVMAPLCLICYFGLRFTTPPVPSWIYAFEIIVGTLQITGCWVFYGSELFLAFVHPDKSKIDIDWNLSFDFQHCFYFWFGFIALPLVWVFVPLYFIRCAMHDISKLSSSPSLQSNTQKKQKKK